MGKGDKKTKRGKIIIGSSGVSRPRKKRKRSVAKAGSKPVAAIVEPLATTVKAAPKKAAKKAEVPEIDAVEKPKAPKSKKKVTETDVPASAAESVQE